MASIVRAILRLYPGHFRRLFGEEVLATTRARVAYRRARYGRMRALWFFLREVAYLARGALRIRFGRRRTSAGPTSDGNAPFLGRSTPDAANVLRRLIRSPRFSLLVIVTLALGIGSTTTIYSLVNGVLSDPLGLPEAEELAYIWSVRPWMDTEEGLVADVQLKDLQQEAVSFSEIAGLAVVSGRILGGRRPVHTNVGRVSHNFFDLLGVEPLLGREFREGEDQVGAPWGVVLSYDFWQSEMGGDPAVVGTSMVVGMPDMVVLGVLPEDFRFPLPSALGPYDEPDLWIPFWHSYAESGRVVGSSLGEAVVGRLAPGVSRAEARAELEVLAAREDREYFDSRGFRYRLEGVEENAVRAIRPFLLLLAVGAALLFVASVANGATLLMIRGQRRAGELALRRSLGASVLRLLGDTVFESLVLSVAAGGLGLFVAFGARDMLLATMPGDLSARFAAPIDAQVFLFTAVLSCVAGCVSGIVPALQLRRSDPGRSLRSMRASGSRGTRRSSWVRKGLVSAQVAVSVVLLAGALVLVRTFVEMRSEDPGFDRTGALTFSVYLMDDYPSKQSQVAYFEALSDRLEGIPGVIRVAGASALPLSAGTARIPVSSVEPPAWVDPDRFFLEDDVFIDANELGWPEDGTWSMADLNSAQPGYFEAAGIVSVDGRTFTRLDGVGSERVVVIDDTMAREFFGSDSAVGQRLWIAGAWRRVVGVVRHARMREIHRDGVPQAYLPYSQVRTGRVSVVVRMSGDPSRLAADLREEVATIDPMVPIADVESVESIVAEATAGERFALLLLGIFAGSALVLTGLGLYGVFAFQVGARRREIAVRLAVGSTGASVVGRVVGDGYGTTAIGLVVGLVGVRVAGGVLEVVVVGSEIWEPVGLSATALLLLLVATASTVLPARRAARIDPAEVLRDG